MNTPRSELTPLEVREMLTLVADRIIAAEPELSQADRDLGDGDHGLGMQRGMEAAKVALADLSDDSTTSDAFSTMGKAMMSSMGGASGVIFGTVFKGSGKALKNYIGGLDSRGLSMALAAASQSVMDRGGAKPGDKTMLDALVPASKKAAAVVDQPIGEAIQEIAAAAEAGRDESKKFIATMGRAKTLGERSIGFPDAGACSVAIIFRTMADYISELS